MRTFQIEVSVVVPKNTTIERACGEVKELSEFLKEDIDFKFNGVNISTANKTINEMVKSYMVSR